MEFKKIFLKRCSKIFMSMCVLSILTSGGAEAFNSTTHKYVTETSIKAVSNINKNIQFNEEECNVIADYSLKPDEDEIEGAYKLHFFNPVNEKNFMGEKKSASAKCDEHFSEAIKHFKCGNKIMALQELGRAIHFMEDLNTPVHTGYSKSVDAVLMFPLHIRFEKICDDVCKECKSDIKTENLKYYEENDLVDISKNSASTSSDNYWCLTNETGISDKEIAKNAVSNALNNVSGIIHKFYIQIS